MIQTPSNAPSTSSKPLALVASTSAKSNHEDNVVASRLLSHTRGGDQEGLAQAQSDDGEHSNNNGGTTGKETVNDAWQFECAQLLLLLQASKPSPSRNTVNANQGATAFAPQLHLLEEDAVRTLVSLLRKRTRDDQAAPEQLPGPRTRRPRRRRQASEGPSNVVQPTPDAHLNKRRRVAQPKPGPVEPALRPAPAVQMPKKPRKNLNEQERKALLEGDPWATNVAEDSAECKACGTTIKLDARFGKYYTHRWLKHRRGCRKMKQAELPDKVPAPDNDAFKAEDVVEEETKDAVSMPEIRRSTRIKKKKERG